MKRKPLHEVPCSIARSLAQVGEWWSLLIVRDLLLFGPRRFGELLESLGCARNMLSARLKGLATAGVLTTRPAADGSAYQEYVLTEKGADLYPVIIALREWGTRWNRSESDPTITLIDRRTGEPIAPLLPRCEDGTPVPACDIEVRHS